MFNGPEIHDNILVQVESSVHNEQDEPMWIRKKAPCFKLDSTTN